MQTLNRLKSERPRREYDFYETPAELCQYSLSKVILDEGRMFYDVLDAGCGKGVWGSALHSLYSVQELSNLSLDGIDTQDIESNLCYTAWYHGDFLSLKASGYDFIMGNPPYSLAEEFVRKGLELISMGGYIFFLLRLAFLESKKRYFGLFDEFRPKRVYVLSRRPSFFSSNEKTKTTDAMSYAMFLWQEGWKGKTELDWLYWEYEK